MSNAMIGLAVGTAFGILDYMVLSALSKKATVESSRKAVQTLALAALLLLPVLGYVIGAYVFV